MDIDVQLDKTSSNLLTMEKPQKVKFRLTNMTKQVMKLQLKVLEAYQGDILICGCYPQISGKIDRAKDFEFELELLPRTCGVAGISGLRIYDTVSEKNYVFTNFKLDPKRCKTCTKRKQCEHISRELASFTIDYN